MIASVIWVFLLFWFWFVWVFLVNIICLIQLFVVRNKILFSWINGLRLVTGEKEGLLLFFPKQGRGTPLPLLFHSQGNEHFHYAGQCGAEVAGGDFY